MRGKPAPKRKINTDPKYHNLQIAKFINYIMRRGKKSVAQRVVYGAFDIIKEKTKRNPLEVFSEALRNISPLLEVRSRRIGGANYQIPMPVRAERRFILGSRWLINAAKTRKGKPMAERLALELLDAAQGIGAAVKKKEDTHRMAEANRAFAHFLR
jgi:small subunit ribosomal protein S7